MDELPITPQPVLRFAEIIGDEPVARFDQTMATARERLAGRTLWHVNSTAEGGGVAEMLQSILGYPAACDVPVRWLVIGGNDDFFEVTKRLHHLLHGSPGDGGQLGPQERQTYESALAPEAARLVRLVRPGDPVILHDPQTLGLAPRLAAAGARVIWSCHIGADAPNELTRAAWRFLAPYTEHTAYQVFSRRQYGWDVLDPARVVVIPPCIDAFSAKNQALGDDSVAAVLGAAGLVPSLGGSGSPSFERRDGTSGRVGSRARLIEDVPVPADAHLVTQISRWDPLKDHAGVLAAFAHDSLAARGAHLMLAGPAPESIADDPEGTETLEQLEAAWRALPADRRQTVHIACLPMADLDENATIVNALQRRSDVVVQKSLAEGFGLTVAEAMWKGRPTVGSRVGGIQDQIEPDVSGLLVAPDDLPQFAAAVRSLLDDPPKAGALGSAARERVCAEYLAPRHLERYLQLVIALG